MPSLDDEPIRKLERTVRVSFDPLTHTTLEHVAGLYEMTIPAFVRWVVMDRITDELRFDREQEDRADAGF